MNIRIKLLRNNNNINNNPQSTINNNPQSTERHPPHNNSKQTKHILQNHHQQLGEKKRRSKSQLVKNTNVKQRESLQHKDNNNNVRYYTKQYKTITQPTTVLMGRQIPSHNKLYYSIDYDNSREQQQDHLSNNNNTAHNNNSNNNHQQQSLKYPHYISKSNQMISMKQKILQLKHNIKFNQSCFPIIETIQDSINVNRASFTRKMKVQVSKKGNTQLMAQFEKDLCQYLQQQSPSKNNNNKSHEKHYRKIDLPYLMSIQNKNQPSLFDNYQRIQKLQQTKRKLKSIRKTNLPKYHHI